MDAIINRIRIPKNRYLHPHLRIVGFATRIIVSKVLASEQIETNDREDHLKFA
jgi:hypothetical protein